MLVVAGVPCALVAAARADGDAGLQQRRGNADGGGGRPAHYPHGGGADVGAIPAEPDARDHRGHVLLTQISVGAGDAGLGTVAERVDGGGQDAGIGVDVAWVGVQQLPGVAHASLGVVAVR